MKRPLLLWSLVAIELLLLGRLVLPFVVSNNLLAHDLVGHLALAEWSAQHLWPRPSGWDPRFFCGAPLGLLYPPALTWLSAGLGQLLDVGLALRLWVGLGILATPPAIAFFLRRAGLGAPAAAIGMLTAIAYLALRPGDLGGTFFSTLQTGNVAEALGLPLFFVFAGSVASLLVEPTEARSIALAALTLAALCVTHLVAGLVGILVLVVAGAIAEPDARRRLITAAVVGFLLSAFFTVPMMFYRGPGADELLSYDEAPDLVVETLGSLTLFAFAFIALHRRRALRTFAPPLLVGAAIFLLRAFVLLDPPRGGWHLHRFKLFDQLLLVTVVAAIAVELFGSRRRALVIAAVTGVLGLIGVLRVDARGVPAQALPSLPSERPAGRVLVVAPPDKQVSDHALQHLVAMRLGVDVGKGLFVESARHARLLFALEQLSVGSPVRIWGVLPITEGELRRLQERVPALLHHLGFGAVLSTEPPKGGVGEKTLALDGGLRWSPLSPAPTAEPISGAMQVYADRVDFEREAVRFLVSGGALPLRPVDNASGPEPTAAPEGTSVRVHEEPHRQTIDLDIEADRPIPVLLRVSHHPGWRIVEGEAVLYEAAPHLMAVVGRGRVVLRFGRDAVGRACDGLTLLGLVALLTLWLPRRRLLS